MNKETGIGIIKEYKIEAALTTVHANIRSLTRDHLRALDHAVTNEFIKRMIEDKNMEARP